MGAPCAPPAARTVLQCSGTSTRASAFTACLATRVTSSTPCASLPTVIGCAPPPTWASESGISRARASLTSSSSSYPPLMPSPRHSPLRVCLLPGLPTATPSSLVTPIPHPRLERHHGPGQHLLSAVVAQK